jgi:hypothetical protein
MQESRKRKRATQPTISDDDKGKESSKRRKPAFKEAEIDDLVRYLEPVQFGLSSAITVAHIEATRGDFLTRVKHLTTLTGKKNKETVSTFSPNQAVEITNYFFSVMLGNDLQQRIAALVEYCNSGEVEGLTRASSSLALLDLGNDENIPLTLRSFYLQFAHAHRQYLEVETPYSTLMRHKENLALQDKWQNLVSKGSGSRLELIKYLKASPVKNGFKTALKKHVCSNLKIESTKLFEKSMEAERGIRTLVNYFGNGILVILPPGAEKK